jgi:very-short-patch-repair endonuclease
MTLSHDIENYGGLAATHELYSRGWTKRSLAIAVAEGAIIRVRQGWYTLPSTSESQREGVRVGGQLGCVSGARLHGLSVRASGHVHVSVAPHTARLRSKSDKQVRLASMKSPGVIVHWNNADAHGTRFVLGVRECLSQMSLCQSPEWVVAAADSALRARLLTASEWRDDIRLLPRRLRRLLSKVDARAESITESVTRFRLEQLGFEPRLQVTIRGVGRVDMVLGKRLVIEVDGYAYHSDPEAFEADRRRDARLSALGYRVLRFSYKQVMHHWSEVRAAITAAVARGDHLA